MEFSPQHFFRLVSPALLQTYFTQRGLLADFDWKGLGKDVTPLFQAWKSVPSRDRHSAWTDFEDAFALFSRRGIQTVIDSAGIQREQVRACMGKGSIADRVFRALLEYPDVFQIAGQFAWADNLRRHWRPRLDIPPADVVVNPETLEQLKQAVVSRYRELDDRGEYSEVEAHWRGDELYILIYMSDHPEAVVHFEDSNQLTRSTQQRAFDVVYRYEPATGAFQLYAEADREFCRNLAQDFVGSILRSPVQLPLDEVLVFDLEKLKDPDFQFQVDGADGVRSLELRSMRLSADGDEGGRITFGSPPRARKVHLHDFIRRGLNAVELPLQSLTVEHVTINARIARNGQRATSVTFSISSSSTCNLKATRQHDKIRRCLKRSGVILGQSAGEVADPQ